MKCIFCKSKTFKRTVEYREHGISLGPFPATVCKNCHEQFFDVETAKKIQRKSQEKGLFGLSKKVKVGRVGDSLVVQIPKTIAAFTKLKEGKEVSVHPEGNNIIIEN